METPNALRNPRPHPPLRAPPPKKKGVKPKKRGQEKRNRKRRSRLTRSRRERTGLLLSLLEKEQANRWNVATLRTVVNFITLKPKETPPTQTPYSYNGKQKGEKCKGEACEMKRGTIHAGIDASKGELYRGRTSGRLKWSFTPQNCRSDPKQRFDIATRHCYIFQDD